MNSPTMSPLRQATINEKHTREQNVAAYDVYAKDYDKVSTFNK